MNLKTSVCLAFISSVTLVQAQEWKPADPNTELMAPATNSDTRELTVRDPQGNVLTIGWESDAEGAAITEGDIVIGTALDLQSHTGTLSLSAVGTPELFGLVTRRSSRKWPGGEVYYRIDPALPKKDRVTAAIAEWKKKSPLTFVKIENDSGDHILFTKKADVCRSSLGRVGGRQLIELDDACQVGAVIHEIGHAVGLAHEHMRSDRDSKLIVHWENIMKGKETQFHKRPHSLRDENEYCLASVMHYGPTAFAVDSSKPTLSSIDPGTTFGQRRELAPCDIATVEKFYGFTGTGEDVASGFEGNIRLGPEGCEAVRKCFVLEDLKYTDPDGLIWLASKRDPAAGRHIMTGLTDGASIPAWAQPFIGKPYDQSYLKAAIVHDHYSYDENHVRGWRATQRMFHDALQDLNLPKRKADIMYLGVLIGSRRWTELVPGDNCGPNCINDFIDGRDATRTDDGGAMLFEEERFDSEEFLTLFETGREIIEAAYPEISASEVEEIVQSLLPNDPFLIVGDRHYLDGLDDPTFGKR